MKDMYHWLGVAVYCLFMVYIGWRIREKIRHDDGEQVNYEFWIAKRQLPGWRLAISLTAGWLMLGWVGFGMSQIYMYGATGLWILPIPWLILCVIVIFMVPYVRRLASVSLPQAFQKRYGYSSRVMLGMMSFFVFISWTQAELFMGGRLMAPFLPVPAWICSLFHSLGAPQATEMQVREWVSMIVLVLPILLYIWMGGFRANVSTDVAQFAIMAPFMIILAVVALNDAGAAGKGNIWDAISKAAPPTSGAGKAMDLGFLGWLFPVVLLIGYLPGWMIEQDLIIRLQAAQSTREAKKAAWWGLLFIGVFVIVLPSIIAFCALVVYPPDGANVNPAIGENAYNICSAFIQKLPLWLSVFMLVGIVACQMSTVDTFANVSALALSYDLIEPVMAKKKATSKARLLTAKWISMFAIVLSLALALVNKSLQDVYYISSGVLSACIAVPALFVFWKRTTLSATLTAAVLGFAGTVGGFWYEYHILDQANAEAANHYTKVLPAWMHNTIGYHYIALGVLLSLVSIVVVSLVTGPATKEQLASLQPAPVEDYSAFVSQTLENGLSPAPVKQAKTK